MKKLYFLIISLFVLAALAGCSGSEESAETTGASADSGPVEGGELNVAISADPNTLDWMYTGESAARKIGWHIYEGLFALNQDYEATPLLADSYEVSEDGQTYTINLREGLTFHNGEEVTAEDAVASVERWLKISSVGKITNEHVESVEKVDDLQLKINLNKAYSSLLSDLAAPKSAAVVLPASVAEEAGENPLDHDQFIGTGPFKFDSWKRGDEIVLGKFEDYVSREDETSGLTGEKKAYVDEIHFKIVKDPQVVLNGLKTGLYDYGEDIPLDLHEVIEATPGIEAETAVNGYTILTPDKSEAPFDDMKVRQALHAALDKEAIAKATYGNDAFYDLDGALFTPNQTALYSDQHIENFNGFDTEKAKQLLEESSYDGEPIKIIFSNDHSDYKKIAEISEQQLEAAGFDVELESFEWATYLEKWSEASNWDLVVIGWSPFFSPNQAGMLSQDSNSSGWYNSEKWQGLISQWATAESDEEKEDILAALNQTLSEELPFEKVTNVSNLDARSSALENFSEWYGPRYWNTWKSE
ncbi:ABC transporter substrate-binding protein [Jeotgalibacillus haloalkalitolerans]|uniref:ABC transporter substrate-binding protein n=1 Tax=Jeotgalibacillus haloalkalitolerans TaxID=3104292 RepID=A0ABU5KND4_9BACL|nr:ABC transporter substrate-binding protein [Jeotgalibacillus sp. HH7-29]MDZ5712767.1 ABC transporter substrate-binding protein [Jeotgalibacillus sp. HH7-29]